MSRSIELLVNVKFTTRDNKINNKLIKLPLNFNISDEYTDDEIIKRFKPRINLISNGEINSEVSVNGVASDVSYLSSRKRKRRNAELDTSSLSPPPGQPTHNKLTRNPTISKYWQEFSNKTNLDSIYLSEHVIPLYKSFFGKASLESATNRKIHMVYQNDAIVLLVEPTSSTLNLARIIDFDSIDAIKIRESKGKEPMFGFKLKPDSLLSLYLKQFNFSDSDWITLFPDSRHPLFLPDYESRLVFNLKLLAKKKKLQIDKVTDDQIVSMYQNCIS